MGKSPSDITVPDILEDYDIAFNKLWAVDVDFLLQHVPILAKIPGKLKNAVDTLLRNKSKAEELMYHEPKVRILAVNRMLCCYLPSVLA